MSVWGEIYVDEDILNCKGCKVFKVSIKNKSNYEEGIDMEN